VKKIGTLLLGCLFLAACSNLRQMVQRNVKPQPVPQVTAPANRELRRGMSPQEVKAIWGEPDDRVIYAGEGAPERWKYNHYPDNGLHLGNPASTIELLFVNGQLQKWLTRKSPSQKGPGEK